MITTGLGESQQGILRQLKRDGSGTIPAIAAELALNVETVRAHLRSLGDAGLVVRSGRRRRGPGRPEIIYSLTEAAQALFPDRQGELLRDFAAYVQAAGEGGLLEGFLEELIERRRGTALERVRDLQGDERVEEVARILTEEGFMAEVESDDAGRRVLRLNHCPIRQLVRTTRTPCRVELDFVRELLGESLARTAYIPAGDSACCYAIGRSA